MRVSTKIALAGASLLSLMTFTTPALAADEDGEIVVQARRKDESLLDVPLTVNAVTSETLAKLNIRDMKDITGVVPGLVLNSGNRTTGSQVSLRGLNVDNTSSGNNGTVEFYLNDAPVTSGAVLQTMFDVGQIEVLRGPQGTLRGRASPSGSITLTTRRPDMDQWGGNVQGTVNGNGGINTQAAINIPLFPGVLSFRVAGLFDNNEGSRVKSINNQTLESSNKSRGVRASVRAMPFDGLELNASYTHFVKNAIVWDQVESAALATGGTVVGPRIDGRDRRAVSNVPNRNHMAFDIFNWQARYSFLGQRVDYVGSFTKQDLNSTEPRDKGDFFDASYPGDASLPNSNGTYISYAPTLNLQNVAQATHTYSKQETHELRLSSEERLFGMANYVVGGFVSRLEPWSDLINPTTFNFNGSVEPGNFTGIAPANPVRRRGRTLERSVFGNLTLHFGDQTELSAGTRYINYKANQNYSSVAVPFSPTNDEFNAWIWSASFKHRFNENLMAYASAGSSFRVGSGTNNLILLSSGVRGPIVDPVLDALSQITPERSRSYEIGLRSTWLDRKLTINISAFHQDFDGYIFPIPANSFSVANNTGTAAAPVLTGTPLPIRSSMAASVPAKVDGIEAEIAIRPIPNFSLSGSIAYANARIVNGTLPFGSPPAGQQVGTRVVSQKASRIAPVTASVQSEYSHDISGDLDGFARGLLTINGNSQNDPTNPYDDVKAYALANLYLGVRAKDGSWEVTAYGKNLFNTFRVLERNLGAETVTTNLGSRASNYRVLPTVTDPREFGITARFAFGSR